jgi:protein-tyrosine-phosphatase
MEKTLVFVCSGNTCRSPLAWAAWQALSAPPPGMRALSAGLFATPGAAASPYTIELARQWGVDLSGHQARSLHARLLQSVNLVCVMTPEHADTLRQHFHTTAPIVLLGSFASYATDEVEELPQSTLDSVAAPAWMELPDGIEDSAILDPFGGSREAYESCARQIQRSVTNLAAALRDGKLLLSPE